MSLANILAGIVKGLLYLAFFVVCTVFFTYLTFPEEKVRSFAEAKASEHLGSKVRIGDLTLRGLGGVEVTDVTMRLDTPQPTAAAEGEAAPKKKPARPRLLRAERLFADISLLSLLFDHTVAATFEADVQGGEVRDGAYEAASGLPKHLRVAKIEGIRFGADQTFKELIGYDLRGRLSGTVDLTFGDSPDDLRADIALTLADASVVKPVVPSKQFGPIILGDIDLGDLTIKLKADKLSQLSALKRGRARRHDPVVAHFEEVSASGKDVDLSFDDQSVVRFEKGRPFSSGRLSVHMAVRIKDEYIDRSVPDENGHMTQPNQILKMAMTQDRRLRTLTRDGTIGIYCRGTISKPDCGVERSRVRGAFGAKRRPTFSSSDEDEPTARRTIEDDDEDRAAADEEEEGEEEAPSRAGSGRIRSAADRLPPDVKARYEAAKARARKGRTVRTRTGGLRKGSATEQPTVVPAEPGHDTAYDPPGGDSDDEDTPDLPYAPALSGPGPSVPVSPREGGIPEGFDPAYRIEPDSTAVPLNPPSPSEDF